MADSFFDDESILQVHMLEAWKQRGNQALKVIEAYLKGFATKESHDRAQEDYQYCGQWYAYWVNFGRGKEVNSGK